MTSALKPDLGGHVERVSALVKKMKLPMGLKITASEYLDGDSFSCYFRFSRFEEFEQYVHVLKAAADADVVSQLIDALNAPPR